MSPHTHTAPNTHTYILTALDQLDDVEYCNKTLPRGLGKWGRSSSSRCGGCMSYRKCRI